MLRQLRSVACMEGRSPLRSDLDWRCQAIAKAETVSGNAGRLGRSVHLCLCKTPGQDRLAALLLLVRSGRLGPGR